MNKTITEKNYITNYLNAKDGKKIKNKRFKLNCYLLLNL